MSHLDDSCSESRETYDYHINPLTIVMLYITSIIKVINMTNGDFDPAVEI